MLKIAFFCMGLIIAAVPLAAAADDAQPAGAPERFILVDGNLTGKTYDEFAPGTTTSGWGISAVDEIPVIGHNWAAQVEYRSYSYQHKAAGTLSKASRSPVRWATKVA